MTVYAALLRGVNVGGANKLGMRELRSLFAGLGYGDAVTYLQSGNVVFTGPDGDPAGPARDIERRLRDDLGLPVSVLLRSRDELAGILAGNPYPDRADDPTRLLVTFLARRPERPGRLVVPAGEPAVSTLADREVYVYCPDGYGRTKLNNTYVERRLGVTATTRNWRTVTRLRELAGG